MNLNKLSQKELAALFLVEPRTIRNYMKEEPPVPSHGSGMKLYFVWEEALEWRDRRKHRSLYAATETRTPDAVDEKQERALLVRQQRESAEISNAVKKRETLSLADFSQAMEDMITPAKINLLAMSSRLAPVIGVEHAAKVHEEVKRSLRSLGGETPAQKAG